MGRGSALWLALSILAPSTAMAQEPLYHGGQGVTFWSRSARANGYTPGDQDYGDVVMDSLGNVLVTWNGDSPACLEHTCYGEFVGQLYDAGGFPIGGEIVFNGTSDMYGPQWGHRGAAALPGIGFVVAWADTSECGDIKAQFLAPDGTLIGENFTVSFSLPECPGPYMPVISTNTSGRWIIIWWDGIHSWGQIFDGPEPQGNALTLSAVDVTMAESGEFNVVTFGSTGDTLFLQRHSVDGEPSGDPIRVDTEFPVGGFCSDCSPKIAADAQGRVVIVWSANGTYARRFTWQGEPLEPTMVLSEHRGGSPDIAMDSAGNFVVVYGVILGQRVSADWTKVGHEFLADSPPWYAAGGGPSGAAIPQVSLNDQGLFVVTWHTPGFDGWGDQVAIVFDFNAPDFMRGDPNGDGAVDLSDVLAILGHLFLTSEYPKPTHPDAADVNDDGAINLSDAIHLLFYIFLGEPRYLPHPGAFFWGFDSTPDSLGE